MNEIKCPKCGQVFAIDEADYTAIAQQVRTNEFQKELQKQLDKEVELSINKLSNEKDSIIAEKNNEITSLTEKLKSIVESDELKKRSELDKLKRENSEMISKLKEEQKEKITELDKELGKKREEIAELNSRLKSAKLESDLRLKDEISKLQKDNDETINGLKYQLKSQEDEIERLKNAKLQLSTKMVGESLEKHCEDEYNKIRPYAAFRNAEFGKDNTVTDGTKGDYIFRIKDETGIEIISIMFEMKNEMDETRSKHKNEDFFAKLDKDRKNKNCEYAVLVSLLEKDSELYNQGIVDVSYEYEKMYVVRPQFFIPIISILYNSALNSMQYKRKLEEIKNQEIDITHFEENIDNFKNAFSKNYTTASKQFKTAIDEIDKTIEHLKKVKDNLTKSENNLRLANDKAQKLTIKTLTKDNQTMIEMFENLEKEGKTEI